jgi:hypothetical protein
MKDEIQKTKDKNPLFRYTFIPLYRFSVDLNNNEQSGHQKLTELTKKAQSPPRQKTKKIQNTKNKIRKTSYPYTAIPFFCRL